jgi:hypothetical protein
MNERQRRAAIAAFFAFILLVDWFLYFRHIGHFFQADTIFLLGHRATSVLDYLKEFVRLNPSGWYRPLTNELIESIFYPFAGLNPIPYRIPVYVVFIGISIAVYALALAVTRRHLAAGIATFFFSIHTVNAYTTYDLGFMPELLFAFFYLAAALAYLRYVETENKTAYRLSMLCLAGSLLSKEAAVTLPAMLFVTGIIYGQKWKRALRSIAPHAAILLVYLSIAIGYLDVQGVSLKTFLNPSYKPNVNDYVPVLSTGALKNADLSLSWAFNIPRAGQKRYVPSGLVVYLKSFRLVVLALAALALFRSRPRAILFGLAWFWITVSPALPLVAHFLQYYLFLPVAGLAIVVGAAFAGGYDVIRRFQQVLAATAIVLIFGGVFAATSRSILGDIRDNQLLGASARLASATLNDLKRLYPSMPDNTTLFFEDEHEPLVWQHDAGGLIKMAYATDKISALYASQGDGLLPDTRGVLFFNVRDGHLIDQTADFRSNPLNFMKFAESDFELELSPHEVIEGDQYTVSIKHAEKGTIRIAYSLDDGPLETFAASLNEEGKVTFEVSRETRPGMYRFWAFRLAGSKEWSPARETLMVRDRKER